MQTIYLPVCLSIKRWLTLSTPHCQRQEETAISQQINVDNHESETRGGAPEGTLVPFKYVASSIV
jgi:hypothetical protein